MQHLTSHILTSSQGMCYFSCSLEADLLVEETPDEAQPVVLAIQGEEPRSNQIYLLQYFLPRIYGVVF